MAGGWRVLQRGGCGLQGGVELQPTLQWVWRGEIPGDRYLEINRLSRYLDINRLSRYLDINRLSRYLDICPWPGAR